MTSTMSDLSPPLPSIQPSTFASPLSPLSVGTVSILDHKMKERSRQYPKFLGPVAQQGLQLRRRGIVPQKNVLFPTLSVCKSSKFGKLSSFPRNEDLERLLIDCD